MLWVKAFHVICMVTWFAGLFYLPRLFVYHAAAEDKISRERFKIMERKLYYGITTPGGLATIALGLWLLFDYGWTAYSQSGWLHVKLLLVGMLIVYHLHCGKLLKEFARDQNHHSHVFYRWYNEFPVLILVGIIIMIVIKPF